MDHGRQEHARIEGGAKASRASNMVAGMVSVAILAAAITGGMS